MSDFENDNVFLQNVPTFDEIHCTYALNVTAVHPCHY